MKGALSILSCVWITCYACVPSPPALKCDSTNNLKDIIKERTQSSEVTLESIVLKEEIYFPTIIAFEVGLFDPKLKALDFSALDSTTYVRMDNYEQVQDSIRNENKWIMDLIIDHCDFKEFNAVIVSSGRTSDDGKQDNVFSDVYELKPIY